jgi:hypothetical protein
LESIGATIHLFSRGEWLSGCCLAGGKSNPAAESPGAWLAAFSTQPALAMAELPH